MGGSSAGGNSGGGNNNRTKFGYSKPKKPKPKGLVIGFYDHFKKGRDLDRKKRKEVKLNEELFGTPDYQGGTLTNPPSIKEVLDEQARKDQRDRDPNPNPSDYKDGRLKIPKVTTAPTEAEVSQSAATDTTAVAETKKEDDIYTRKKKSKARGRSMMTLTSAQGIKKDDNLILGKRSLLGS